MDGVRKPVFNRQLRPTFKKMQLKFHGCKRRSRVVGSLFEFAAPVLQTKPEHPTPTVRPNKKQLVDDGLRGH
jgi:hypothetical protein